MSSSLVHILAFFSTFTNVKQI